MNSIVQARAGAAGVGFLSGGLGADVASLEAQYLALLQSPEGSLSHWNDYRQQAEAADDFATAATSPAMTYVIGSNKEVRLQPLYTPDWQTVNVHTNAETAKQFAREVFRIALGVYPENYTGGLIGVAVSSEDLAQLTPEQQVQYIADNPNVTVLPPVAVTESLPDELPVQTAVVQDFTDGALTVTPDFSDVESGSSSGAFPSEDVYGPGEGPGSGNMGLLIGVAALGALFLFGKKRR